MSDKSESLCDKSDASGSSDDAKIESPAVEDSSSEKEQLDELPIDIQEVQTRHRELKLQADSARKVVTASKAEVSSTFEQAELAEQACDEARVVWETAERETKDATEALRTIGALVATAESDLQELEEAERAATQELELVLARAAALQKKKEAEKAKDKKSSKDTSSSPSRSKSRKRTKSHGKKKAKKHSKNKKSSSSASESRSRSKAKKKTTSKKRKGSSSSSSKKRSKKKKKLLKLKSSSSPEKPAKKKRRSASRERSLSNKRPKKQSNFSMPVNAMQALGKSEASHPPAPPAPPTIVHVQPVATKVVPSTPTASSLQGFNLPRAVPRAEPIAAVENAQISADKFSSFGRSKIAFNIKTR